jgi:hypothetical protein
MGEKRFAVRLGVSGLKNRVKRGAYFLGYMVGPDSAFGSFHRGWREEVLGRRICVLKKFEENSRFP